MEGRCTNLVLLFQSGADNDRSFDCNAYIGIVVDKKFIFTASSGILKDGKRITINTISLIPISFILL